MATHRLKRFSTKVNFGDASIVDRGLDISQLDKLYFYRRNLAVETFLQFYKSVTVLQNQSQLSFCHSESEPRNDILVHIRNKNLNNQIHPTFIKPG